MALSLQVSTSEAIVAQCLPPSSEPAKSAFLRFRAIGLIERSTTLESISILPSSRKRPRPAQRLIPIPAAQYRCAQSRIPIEMMRHG